MLLAVASKNLKMNCVDGRDLHSEPLPPYSMYEKDTSPKPPKYRSRRWHRCSEKMNGLKDSLCEGFLNLFSMTTIVDKRYYRDPLYLANIM